MEKEDFLKQEIKALKKDLAECREMLFVAINDLRAQDKVAKFTFFEALEIIYSKVKNKPPCHKGGE